MLHKKAVAGDARHGEHRTFPSVSYPWAVTKKSATINDSGSGCRDTSLLELLTGLEPVTSSLPTNQEMP